MKFRIGDVDLSGMKCKINEKKCQAVSCEVVRSGLLKKSLRFNFIDESGNSYTLEMETNVVSSFIDQIMGIISRGKPLLIAFRSRGQKILKDFFDNLEVTKK